MTDWIFSNYVCRVQCTNNKEYIINSKEYNLTLIKSEIDLLNIFSFKSANHRPRFINKNHQRAQYLEKFYVTPIEAISLLMFILKLDQLYNECLCEAMLLVPWLILAFENNSKSTSIFSNANKGSQDNWTSQNNPYNNPIPFVCF